MALPPTSCQSQNVTYLLLTPSYFLSKIPNLFTYISSAPTPVHPLFLTETAIVVSRVLSLTSLLLLSITHHSIFRRVFLNTKPHHVTTLLSSHSLSVFIRALSNWVIILRGRWLKCFLKYLKLETLSGFIDILKWIDEKILEHEYILGASPAHLMEPYWSVLPLLFLLSPFQLRSHHSISGVTLVVLLLSRFSRVRLCATP